MIPHQLREIDLHLTNRCNLLCRHCSVDSARTPYRELDLEVWKQVVDTADSLDCQVCDLTGGEAVLYPEVEELVQYISRTEMRLVLQSNGILLTPDRLRALKDAGLSMLVISLDGPPEVHDVIRGRERSWHGAVAAIHSAVRMGFQVRVTRVLVDAEPADDMVEFVKWLENSGVSHLSLNRVSPVTPAHFREFPPPDASRWLAFTSKLESLAASVRIKISYEVAFARSVDLEHFMSEETRCLIERRGWLLVRSDGEVFPCYHFVHSDRMSLGNVAQRPLDQILANDLYWHSYEELQVVPSACTDCQCASLCRGGCPSPGYLRLGSLAIKDERCQVEQGFVPVCPFIKRTAGGSSLTNIAPYYRDQYDQGRPVDG